ncbi:MAG: sigW 7 [Clostridiales bacterium]|nr:sigW 7 [Clostridiales bacterium]
MGLDKDLITEIKNGDRNGFELVIITFQQPIFVYCYRMLSNMQEAEDAVQEVFLKIYEKINNYKEDISFSAWVYKIAYNHCVNQIRRRKLLSFIPLHNFIEQIEDENNNSDKILEFEFTNELNEALSILSMEDRSIVIFRVIEDKSYEEIGLILNRNAVLVRKRYERAKKKLGEHLKERGGSGNNEKIAII